MKNERDRGKAGMTLVEAMIASGLWRYRPGRGRGALS